MYIQFLCASRVKYKNHWGPSIYQLIIYLTSHSGISTQNMLFITKCTSMYIDVKQQVLIVECNSSAKYSIYYCDTCSNRDFSTLSLPDICCIHLDPTIASSGSSKEQYSA